MIEQELCGPFQQGSWIHPGFREPTVEIERGAYCGWRFIASHRTTRHAVEALRDLIYESMSQRAERLGVHRERRMPNGIVINAGALCC
jgi:hypothetical protein